MDEQSLVAVPPQLGLFDRPEPAVDATFAGLSRRRLDASAWVDYVPGWMSGHQALFETLRDGVAWHAERRPMYDRVVDVPRLTAGLPEDGACPVLLRDARRALERRYGRAFGSVRLAWYRDGRDSVAMHGDRVGRRIADTVIAIVSLGARRSFLLKPAAGGPSIRLRPGAGDLLVMGGACQRTWRHGIPKVRAAQPRISVQFRERSEEG